jgi:hypothetical protein
MLFQVSRHVDTSQHMTRILEDSISGSPTIITALSSSPLDDVITLTGGQAKVIISLSCHGFVFMERKNMRGHGNPLVP